VLGTLGQVTEKNLPGDVLLAAQIKLRQKGFQHGFRRVSRRAAGK
jgi:hypothetical protein